MAAHVVADTTGNLRNYTTPRDAYLVCLQLAGYGSAFESLLIQIAILKSPAGRSSTGAPIAKGLAGSGWCASGQQGG